MRALSILAVLVFALPADAADKWTSIRSKNFLLVGNATENEIRDVAENLELFRTAYSRFFTLQEKAASVGTTVVVFKTDVSFRPFKPVYQGKPANIAGFFQGGQDVNYIALSADIPTPRVIYHEYVHRLMSDNLASMPPWFQEGFAECFSTLEIEGRDKKIRMGRAIGEHVALLSQRQFMPLERLFAVTHESREYNEEERQGLFYAESWALVHYMMLGPQDRKDRFFAFLNGLNKGTPAPAVFERVFQTDLSSFQKVFEAYIQQRSSWPAMELRSPGALDRNRDMTATTLTEAESEFYLGDLLLHSNRLSDGETHLKNAITLDPMLATAQAAMGRLLVRQNKETEAMAYLQRATELDPGNYLTHYYYASSIQSRNRTQTEAEWNAARAELLKTIELAPQFVAATEMLANINLSRNTDIPQTVDLLRNARTFAPGNDNLAVMLAFALLRTPDRESARPLAESVLMNASLSPAMRKNAETVIASLNRQPEVLIRTSQTQAPQAIPAGAVRVRGTLTLMDCRQGVTLSLVAEGKTLKFRADSPSLIRFSTQNPALVSTLGCGPLPGNGVPATVTYRPQEAGEVLGEPLIVELGEARQ
jgi:tetratricopeptide (TPR) repeat protein